MLVRYRIPITGRLIRRKGADPQNNPDDVEEGDKANPIRVPVELFAPPSGFSYETLDYEYDWDRKVF